MGRPSRTCPPEGSASDNEVYERRPEIRHQPNQRVSLHGGAALLVCALAGMTVITASALFLSIHFDAEKRIAERTAVVVPQLEESERAKKPALAVEVPASEEFVSNASSHLAATPKLRTVAFPQQVTQPKTTRLPAPRRLGVLQVSDPNPQRGKGIRITLQLADGVNPTSPPELRLVDAKGREYRSEMRPGDGDSMWEWASGLDVAGRWRGKAIARCDGKSLVADLPAVTVSR
jgi:hypothetical protein